ncbi:DUF2524 domain-containing protein, partial [Xenorhabdus sp. 18]|nr:DUF2524 domain-containing protein [Xenorhabdus sp. 18]
MKQGGTIMAERQSLESYITQAEQAEE